MNKIMFLEDSSILMNNTRSMIEIPLACYCEDANFDFYSNKQILQEKAKWDLLLNNFMEEGEDYRDLKLALREVCELNSSDDVTFKRKKRTVLHAIKRFIQCYDDVAYAINAVSCLAIATIPFMIIPMLLNRLERFCVDSVEYNTLKKDTQEIISQLKVAKEKTKDKKAAEKIQKGIDKLERMLREQDY